MIVSVKIEEFVELAKEIPVVDVRSESEYKQGHFSGAFSIPLFNDEERKIVGTKYKKESPLEAMSAGLGFAKTRLSYYAQEAAKISKNKKLLLYCWRGGMRSKSFSFVMQMCGIDTYVLEGGYKSIRNEVLQLFTTNFKLIILGGYTGSAKTEILQKLKDKGEQVIDLEGLAHHKGSAFGWIDEEAQTSTEYFENRLWAELKELDINKKIWVEDESMQIGRNTIPKAFFDQMKVATVIKLNFPVKQRIEFLISKYTSDDTALIDSIEKIKKRLGGLDTKNAIEAVKNKNYALAAELLLKYYDKAYEYGLSKREEKTVFPLELEDMFDEEVCEKIIQKAKE